MIEDKIRLKEFNFLSAVTGVVVSTLLISATAALFMRKIDWNVYFAMVGTMANMLLGIWTTKQKEKKDD